MSRPKAGGTAPAPALSQAIEIRPVDHSSILCCQIAEGDSEVTALFYGRRHIAGVEPGTRIRLHGPAAPRYDGRLTMINPAYELINDGDDHSADLPLREAGLAATYTEP